MCPTRIKVDGYVKDAMIVKQKESIVQLEDKRY
jgi:hypothetical protein